MIAIETLEKVAGRYQAAVFPNILREYFQHVFLGELYKLPEAEAMLFKGGTALRILYGSPRFSEDLDFSLFEISAKQRKSFIEELFVKVLTEIERIGIKVEIGKKVGATTGGYFGSATFQCFDYQPADVAINVSARTGYVKRGEVDSIVSDFVPTYSVVHLSQRELVAEKVFGALCKRKKPRDFYDLYFMMRKGMLSIDQKVRLAEIKAMIVAEGSKIDFRGELGAFLPADQQILIRDFLRALVAEMDRQIA